MQSWLEGRNWKGKCAQATGMTASLRILSSKADSNTWESFHAQTSSGKELPNHFWNRNIVRSILSELRRKRTGLLLSGPKSSFQMKVHFQMKSLEEEWRDRIHVAWSPVWSFYSQWWFGLPCHLLVLSVHCVFWSPQSLSRGRWETPDPTMQMTWRPLSKASWASLHLSSATDWSPPWHAALMQ